MLEYWNGTWNNFENYIDDRDPSIQKAWEEAKLAFRKILVFSLYSLGNCKRFWKKVCNTKQNGNKVRIDTMEFTSDKNTLYVDYIAQNRLITSQKYTLLEILPSALEHEPGYLFKGDQEDVFQYLLLMKPMEPSEQIISHFHFQFGSSREMILKGNKLRKRLWYATMCDGKASKLDKCNIILALHKAKLWEQLK